MTAVVAPAISNEYVKVRWNERYVSQAVNQQAEAHAGGCYRGLHLAPEGPASTNVVLRQVDPWAHDEGEHFAVVADHVNGWAVAFRDVGDITLDLAAALVAGTRPGTPTGLLYVYLTAVYAQDVATVAAWEWQWTTDPRGADPTAVVIGVLEVPLAAAVFDFSPIPGNVTRPTVLRDWTFGVTDTQRDFAFRRRSRPIAVAMDDDTVALTADENVWGFLHGVERNRIPTKDQKDALNAASAPSTANPVATINDVDGLGAKVVGEPARLTAAAVANVVDIDAHDGVAARGFYIGTGAVGSVAAWFDVHAASSSAPLAAADGALIYVASVQKVVAGVPSAMNPAVDADANGFWNPGPVGAGTHYLRLTLATGSLFGAYTGNLDAWLTLRSTVAGWTDTPARALPVAARHRLAHASEHQIQRYLTPPGTPQSAVATVQDAIRRLQVVTRGTVGQGATDIQVAAGSFFQDAAPDQPETTPWATGNIGALVPTLPDYRNLLAAGVAGNRRVIGVLACNPVLGFGPDIIVGDVTTRAVLWTGSMSAAFAADEIPVAVASDGVRLFVRTYNLVSFAHRVHAFYWASLAQGDLVGSAAWAGPVTIGSGNGGFADPFYDPYIAFPLPTSMGYANEIALVSPTRLACNLPWNDLVATSDGIRILNATTGAAVGVLGKGDAEGVGPWYTNVGPIYACGPICGDGTNVFFCVKSVDGADEKKTFVASCQIANTALSNYGAWLDIPRTFGTNAPDVLLYHGREPRGLVYDGAHLWASAGNGIWCGIPGGNSYEPTPEVAGGGVATWEYQIDGGAALMSRVGPIVTDGRFAYVAIVGQGTTGDGFMRVVRLTAQGLPGEGIGGPTITFRAMTEQAWRLSAPEPIGTVGPFGVGDGTVGPALFDGDNVWVAAIDRWDGAEPKSQVMYRVPLVRGW